MELKKCRTNAALASINENWNVCKSAPRCIVAEVCDATNAECSPAAGFKVHENT